MKVAANPSSLGVIERHNSNYRDFDFPLQPKLWTDSGFSLGRFLARYWCGDSALRDDRSVSRKRLALVSAGIECDQQALRLAHQIKLYLEAFQLVIRSQTISTNLICKLNGLLNPDPSRSGRTRTIQNYIGDPKNPRYVPPVATVLPALMHDLVDFANDPSVNPVARAITVHSQLLAIHPFHDGNGRTARVLMDGMIHKAEPNYISLSLNRLRDERSYLDAIQQFGIEGDAGLKHPYWKEAFLVAEDLKDKVGTIITHAERQIYSRLAAFQVSEDERTICRMLWQQPIIHHNNLAATSAWSEHRFATAVERLLLAGVLDMRELKNPAGAMILDCPIVLRAWQQIDQLIFAHELEHNLSQV